jgi:hypothetical protein
MPDPHVWSKIDAKDFGVGTVLPLRYPVMLLSRRLARAMQHEEQSGGYEKCNAQHCGDQVAHCDSIDIEAGQHEEREGCARHAVPRPTSLDAWPGKILCPESDIRQLGRCRGGHLRSQ